jgi:hypothetical protein
MFPSWIAPAALVEQRAWEWVGQRALAARALVPVERARKNIAA